MMDLTASFLELVSSLQSRRPELMMMKDKDRILRRKSQPRAPSDTFERRAHDVSAAIAKLRDFLLDNRDTYLGRLEWQEIVPPSTDDDDQRDRVDAGANAYIMTCNQLIRSFKDDLREAESSEASSPLSPSRALHLRAVCELLENYLKSVCRIYAEHKAIRVQKELELQKMTRLELRTRTESRSEDTLEELMEARRRDTSMDPEEDKEIREGSHVFIEDDERQVEEEEFSQEELQMLEEENQRLYHDLVSVQEGMQQVEHKVVKIAELQEIFTEKVLQQKDEIELIAQTAVTTTENVKDGNEELRKAIQNQASIRVYILFFLLVMSFSLLFLDWYNE